MPYAHKLDGSGPRRLLALDGGGVRGVISIEVLARIEDTLRERLGRGDDFRLSQYFDYVAGTSTGAIIATCVSLGMSVAQIRRFYAENAAAMFTPASLLARFKHKFEREELERKLKDVFGAETRFGGDELETLLLVVLRNATTDSPWPLSNNPHAMFNDRARPDCNLELPLWQVVRASTAAPTFFPPEEAVVGDEKFVFVDGGITPYCNPAFLLFLMATLAPYRLEWPTGEREMLVVSIGTGARPDADATLAPDQMNLLYNASKTVPALLFASVNEQDMLCRAFGRCRTGPPLDAELADLRDVPAPGGAELFTYLRYNAAITRAGLDDLGLRDLDPAALRRLDSVDAMDDLVRVGRALAERDVDAAHFDDFV